MWPCGSIHHRFGDAEGERGAWPFAIATPASCCQISGVMVMTCKGSHYDLSVIRYGRTTVADFNFWFYLSQLYDVVRKEIWYRPDMFFYRDMLMMLARNKKVDEAKRVWEDLKREEVLFDQHTFGDIMRAFLDNELPDEAIEIYAEMRQSPDPPLSLPFRVILKGLIPYPELREKIKADFLELFPGYSVYDPPEDLFEDQDWKTECDLD
uniref:Pentatricopeptide repeat-containing protein n=1 Tax=Chenopodium quinoa TaxID=63459 RepID=A0A803KME3_CHEQI